MCSQTHRHSGGSSQEDRCLPVSRISCIVPAWVHTAEHLPPRLVPLGRVCGESFCQPLQCSWQAICSRAWAHAEGRPAAWGDPRPKSVQGMQCKHARMQESTSVTRSPGLSWWPNRSLQAQRPGACCAPCCPRQGHQSCQTAPASLHQRRQGGGVAISAQFTQQAGGHWSNSAPPQPSQHCVPLQKLIRQGLQGSGPGLAGRLLAEGGLGG